MNKKFNLFSFLISLGLFGSSVVDDDGAGGGDGAGDEFDVDIDDPANLEPDNKTEIDDLKKRLEDTEKVIDAQRNEKALNQVVSDLKATHKGFDEKKVNDYLTELFKTDPERANMLNNSVGFENVWLTQLAPKEVVNDYPNLGRNVTPVNRQDEFLEKLNNGQELTLEEQVKFFN